MFQEQAVRRSIQVTIGFDENRSVLHHTDTAILHVSAGRRIPRATCLNLEISVAAPCETCIFTIVRYKTNLFLRVR